MGNQQELEGRTTEASNSAPNEVDIVSSILSQLSKIDVATRQRIINAVNSFYGITQPQPTPSATQQLRAARPGTPAFSEDTSISPKQFMSEKQPRTDVEKVACLAYYLTHYRDTPYFKTLDISKLNTEAAQIKFSNPTVSVENALKRNYLVPATKGNKQLSVLGEQFVQALPDREKAHAIMATGRPRRKTRKAEGRVDQQTNEQDEEQIEET